MEFLINLLEKSGSQAIDFCEEKFSEFCEVKRDNVGNLIITKNGVGTPVLLDAHLDQVGFIVNDILDNGFVSVSTVGGIDKRLLPATRVKILSKMETKGVFVSVPPHLKEEVKAEELLVDVGCESHNIKRGDRAFFDVKPIILGDEIAGCGIDNRVCVAAIYEILKRTKRAVCVMLSNDEELGLLGATVGARNFETDIAVCLDVSFGNQIDVPKQKSGKIGGGPMVGVSPILNAEITDKLKKSGEHQLEIMSEKTSTNADIIALTGMGIKTGLVSIPIKYMHTQNECVRVSDIEKTITLVCSFLEGEADDK